MDREQDLGEARHSCIQLFPILAVLGSLHVSIEEYKGLLVENTRDETIAKVVLDSNGSKKNSGKYGGDGNGKDCIS